MALFDSPEADSSRTMGDTIPSGHPKTRSFSCFRYLLFHHGQPWYTYILYDISTNPLLVRPDQYSKSHGHYSSAGRLLQWCSQGLVVLTTTAFSAPSSYQHVTLDRTRIWLPFDSCYKRYVCYRVCAFHAFSSEFTPAFAQIDSTAHHMLLRLFNCAREIILRYAWLL